MRTQGRPAPMPYHPIRTFFPLEAQDGFDTLSVVSAETGGSYPADCLTETSQFRLNSQSKIRDRNSPRLEETFRAPASADGIRSPHAVRAPTPRRLGGGRRLARRCGVDLLGH